jgi:hypothetical protein
MNQERRGEYKYGVHVNNSAGRCKRAKKKTTLQRQQLGVSKLPTMVQTEARSSRRRLGTFSVLFELVIIPHKHRLLKICSTLALFGTEF